jgi:hypothetical protein
MVDASPQRRQRTSHVEYLCFSAACSATSTSFNSAKRRRIRSAFPSRIIQPQERIPPRMCVRLRLRTSAPQSQRKTVGRTLVHINR